MKSTHLALTAVVAVATALVAAVGATELLADRIEFSLFVGIPAGLVAAGIGGAVAAVALGRDGEGTRRVAVAYLGFGAGVFVTVLVGAFIVDGGILISTVTGAIVGLVAAAGYLRTGRATPVPRP